MNWLQQARELEAQGQIGDAISVLETAVAMGDESAAVYKELAHLCLLVNEVRAFTNYCHEAMRIDGNDSQPHLMVARAFALKNRWEEAAEALHEAIRIGSLQGEEKEEAEELLAQSEQQIAESKVGNPGFSNL